LQVEFLFNRHLHLTLSKVLPIASRHDFYVALAMSVRDLLMESWIKTSMAHAQADPKRVYYLRQPFCCSARGSDASHLCSLPLP
jgi:starch phosphorylase